MKYWENLTDILAKSVGVGSQPWILTGGRSSLWTHIAATENFSSFAPISREGRFRNEPEEEGQAKLLRWCKKKGVRLAADCAVACDLADIVNPIGLPKDPTGICRNKSIQVLHSCRH